MKLNFNLKKFIKKQEKELISTKTAYFIKENYKHRINPNYCYDVDPSESGITWQPDVYDFAAEIAEKLRCTYILDIGCGLAHKLVSQYPKFKIIGIDYGRNIIKCKNEYQFGKWISWDLERPFEINLDKEILSKSIIICSDVIEHLVNPSNLLKTIKKFLDNSTACIISTPERDLTRGINDFGPPANLQHVREWNLMEFERFLQSYGFNLGLIGLTASNDKNYEKKTILAVLNNNKSKIDQKIWDDFNRLHTKILKKY